MTEPHKCKHYHRCPHNSSVVQTAVILVAAHRRSSRCGAYRPIIMTVRNVSLMTWGAGHRPHDSIASNKKPAWTDWTDDLVFKARACVQLTALTGSSVLDKQLGWWWQHLESKLQLPSKRKASMSCWSSHQVTLKLSRLPSSPSIWWKSMLIWHHFLLKQLQL